MVKFGFTNNNCVVKSVIDNVLPLWGIELKKKPLPSVCVLVGCSIISTETSKWQTLYVVYQSNLKFIWNSEFADWLDWVAQQRFNALGNRSYTKYMPVNMAQSEWILYIYKITSWTDGALQKCEQKCMGEQLNWYYNYISEDWITITRNWKKFL